ncbi:MAG: hypothetical protein QOK23_685 [Gammaproteobacteria bacterium]|jgi:hypothetical protein|nr:hypothetical protein [Gammaproteobacteria bacterium]
MLALCRTSLQGLLIVLALCAGSIPAHAEDWLPISTEELQMSSAPKAPSAPAIYLYRQVDRDDTAPSEATYERIKILTEEGRKYANVEIPYYKYTESVHGIQARTIHQDGSIVKFDGTIFDKSVVERSGLKLMAKTFTLPDVQVGSIIEYRYRLDLPPGVVFDSHWTLSQELFTQHAKYSLNPYRGFALRFSWPQGLPPNTAPPKEESRKICLETRDVPAFVTEAYMPPENELKYRVDFIYQSEDLRDNDKPEVFWRKYGKKQFHQIDKFLDQPRAMSEAVAQIVAPGDLPDAKLRKIYARVQRLRNLSFERARSQQEVDREKIKKADDVKDVWSHGYGDGEQITWLFLALVRAAGIEAYPVLVPTRDMHFFKLAIMNPRDLNTNVVLAVVDGKEHYFDPGARFTPFGMLPWAETGVPGLRPDPSGSAWVQIPLADVKDSRVERKGVLRLNSSGTLEGKVTVTYTGQEALWRRLEERNEDETDRKQFLENQIKADVPSGIVVELTNQPDWEDSSVALVAEYDLNVPGWAAGAGQRTLLPVAFFGAQDKRVFQHAVRTHPIYFKFPYQQTDDVIVELTPNWKMANLPQSRKKDFAVFGYERTGEEENGSLHLKRQFTLNAMFVQTKYYDSVASFFEFVRAGDEDQAILVPVKSNGTH